MMKVVQNASTFNFIKISILKNIDKLINETFFPHGMLMLPLWQATISARKETQHVIGKSAGRLAKADKPSQGVSNVQPGVCLHAQKIKAMSFWPLYYSHIHTG